MMTEKERLAQEKIDRILLKRWTLTEVSVILEPSVSFRVLTSWISGKPLHIRPSIWKPEHFPGMVPVPDRKPDKRAKYGFPNLVQFILARNLFAAKVNREVVQKLCDRIAGGRTTLAVGYYLILIGSEPQNVFFFSDKNALISAIRDHPMRLPPCFVFNLWEIHQEAFDRVEAWEDRRPYVQEVRESILAKGQQEWVERNAKSLISAIKRSSKS